MKTVLLVDDDSINLQIGRSILSAEYDVVLVNSGERALKYLEQKHADIILLDIKMPGMDGFEVMEKIKCNEVWSKIPVIFITSRIDSSTEVSCLRSGAVDFVGKPFIPDVIKTRIERTLELEDYRKNLEYLVEKKTEELLDIQYQVVISMANLIESRDGNTGEHVKRTSMFVKMIANRLLEKGKFEDVLTKEYMDALFHAAPMHDIGKIIIPDTILKKPEKLTDDEFEIMKTHASEGGRIVNNNLSKIEKKKYVDMAYDVATYHHEKWDGGGYPEGLKGEEIPLSARIMAVADVFDALMSKRCYKDAMPLDEAFKVIEESSGTHFDPTIANAFLELRDEVTNMLENEEFEE
ncbi:MAG: response regulator [Lachnospiraceae bacterium]|nr:response regulator [Lachnospiraceae bacterium]